MVLTPPLPAHSEVLKGSLLLSFQTISGMSLSADCSVTGSALTVQYSSLFATSSNCVPPTATLYGVEARPFTARPCEAGWPLLCESQLAPPLSPAETNAVIPCAAA